MKKTIYILLAVVLLISCKSRIHYVPVETIKTEYKDKYIRDSIRVYDSVHVKEKGDTVFIDRYHRIYIDRIKNDSIMIHDSIPYPVEVQVKGDTVYKMRWYEQIFFYVGLIAILIGFIYGAIRLIKKKFF